MNQKIKKYINYFLTGLSAIFPISVTIFVLYKIFIFIDSISSWIVIKMFGRNVVGIGFILTLSIITLFGKLTKNYLIETIMHSLEKLAMKIPLVQALYSGLKELTTLFKKGGKRKFSQVVLIKFPNDKVDSIGFITKDTVNIDGNEKVAVFIPTTPNPGNGFLVYADAKDIELLDISIENAIKCIVSMGTISPDKINKLQK